MPPRATASLSAFSQIRRQMIDGKSGQRKIKTLIKSVDEASHQHETQSRSKVSPSLMLL